MENPAVIRVKGRGTVTVEPDIVILSFDVLALDYDYEKSLAQLNTKVVALRQLVEKTGISPKKLKTTDFDIRSDYRTEDKRQVFNGYQTSQDLMIELELDTSLINAILNGLAKSEIHSDVRFRFGIADKKSLEAEMLKKAVADATMKAGILAKSAGKNLGRLMLIDHSWGELRFESPLNYEYSNSMYETAAMPEIEPDSISESITVEMHWTLD